MKHSDRESYQRTLAVSKNLAAGELPYITCIYDSVRRLGGRQQSHLLKKFQGPVPDTILRNKTRNIEHD